jgi:hypothetical protein
VAVVEFRTGDARPVPPAAAERVRAALAEAARGRSGARLSALESELAEGRRQVALAEAAVQELRSRRTRLELSGEKGVGPKLATVDREIASTMAKAEEPRAAVDALAPLIDAARRAEATADGEIFGTVRVTLEKRYHERLTALAAAAGPILSELLTLRHGLAMVGSEGLMRQALASVRGDGKP